MPAPKPYLVVDLDGTLLRSDMLFECFWSAVGRDWRNPFRSLFALSAGRAALKRHLSQAAAVDVATLPYDVQVTTYLENWRAQGGRTALVTASDQQIAERIAAHLDLFDEVHGSDGVRNLKGAAKADFVAERFSDTDFAYMGDSAADLPVWKKASKAITVNAPAALRRQVESLGTEVEHLSTESRSLMPYAKAIRPQQLVKNILVFLPMLAAHRFDLGTLSQCLLAFVAFGLVAPSVYVLNDLLDLSADRAHPRKRSRPFASGAIPIAHGTWMMNGLLIAGVGVAAVVGWGFLLVMVAYYITTIAYSLHFKRHIAIDICLLAALYTVRIIAGGAATGIPISVWLLAFSTFFFLSLAAVKRQAELIDSARRGKLAAGGRGYTVDDLPVVSQMVMAAGYASVLVMALYVNSPAVVQLYSEPAALWGICFVLLYWISHVAMVAHRGMMHDDPIVFAFKDRISQLCGILIVLFALGGAVM